MAWTLLAELELDLPREEVHAHARRSLEGGLRRAGLSAEFILAGAVECYRRAVPPPASARLGLIWSSLTSSAPETASLLEDVLIARELPMPFQFVASQPHMAAVYADRFLPGFCHATTLAGPASSLDDALLASLCERGKLSHLLFGQVSTPDPRGPGGARFTARWRLLARPAYSTRP